MVNVSKHECRIWRPGQKEAENEGYKDKEEKREKERRNRRLGSRIGK
jgi:hypothetical protein